MAEEVNTFHIRIGNQSFNFFNFYIVKFRVKNAKPTFVDTVWFDGIFRIAPQNNFFFGICKSDKNDLELRLIISVADIQIISEILLNDFTL